MLGAPSRRLLRFARSSAGRSTASASRARSDGEGAAPHRSGSGRRITRLASVLLAALALLAGCATNDGQGKGGGNDRGQGGTSGLGQTGLSNTDPCAMRMHDVCGALLLYYFYNGRLPERLEELNSLPGEGPLQFVCPATNAPYVYNVNGIQIPERKIWIVLHDPSPAHAGMRWAVSMDEPQVGKALVTKVLPLPESFFLMRPPR